MAIAQGLNQSALPVILRSTCCRYNRSDVKVIHPCSYYRSPRTYIYPQQAGPSPPGYGAEDVSTAPLRLRQEDGYEQARRVRNVIEHLRREGAAHKPLVVVVANSGIPEEVKSCVAGGKKCVYGSTSRLRKEWVGRMGLFAKEAGVWRCAR